MSNTGGVGLSIRNMWKVRGDGQRYVNISIPEFVVPPGAFVAVTGPNGSGKSTLLDMLGLLLTPDHAEQFALTGDVFEDLRDLSPSDKRRIRRQSFAYALQGGGLLECYTVRQNIKFAARLNHTPLKIGDKLSRFLGIENILDAYPAKISGGQRQKASLVCALVQRPQIILADEPSGALDPQSALHVMNTFRRITGTNGISLILVTHAPQLVSKSVDAMFHFHLSVHGNKLQSVLKPRSRR